ncbi:MAG TPA: hypothetical protein VF741_03885 [Candidatus Aquilonibacter sp.]
MTLRLEHSPLEKVRLWVEILAFAAAGCWALYTFIYQTRIAPAFVPGHEVFALSMQQLASTRSGTIQRVQLTIRNDGTVDVDTAALAVNVQGTATPALRWVTIASPNSAVLHSPNLDSWTVLQTYGRLLDGAAGGHSHLLLRPGDAFDLQFLVTVPRADHLLVVTVDTSYGRYPIRSHSVAVRLVRGANGHVGLSGKADQTNFVQYFGV